jgi:Skp family chaperone for outer membrane proteins
MKYKTNIITVFFLYLLFINIALGDSKVAFINIDSIISETIIGKKIQDNLNNIKKENLKKLKTTEKKIKDKQDTVNKQKNLITESELKIKIGELNEEFRKFQSQKLELSKNYNSEKKIQLEDFFKKTRPIIEKYMKDNQLEIIFDKKNIFIANSDANISSEIIKLINQEIQ